MIDLGVDESKTTGKPLLVLSAIIGQTSTMRRLAKKWSADLEQFGVDYFHAKEHWNRRAKPYHRISLSKRKELLDRLISYVHKYVSLGLAVIINEDDFKRITTPRFRSAYGSPYSFAIQIMLPLLHKRLKEMGRLHEKANILIEDGHSNSQQILEILRKAVGNEEAFLRVSTVELGTKAHNPILQAADLWAYAACQEMTTGNSQMFRRLLGRTANRFVYLNLDAKLITEMSTEIEANVKRAADERRLQRRPNGETIGRVRADGTAPLCVEGSTRR